MKFYTRYDRVIGIQLEFNLPSLTEQHHKDDCDVNIILERYCKTGVLPENARKNGVYGDFSACAQDYREAVRLLQDAHDRFDSLPSRIRERFDNDPEKLLAFLDNPENEAQARKLGLLATVTDAPEARENDLNETRVPGAAAPGAEADASSMADK